MEKTDKFHADPMQKIGPPLKCGENEYTQLVHPAFEMQPLEQDGEHGKQVNVEETKSGFSMEKTDKFHADPMQNIGPPLKCAENEYTQLLHPAFEMQPLEQDGEHGEQVNVEEEQYEDITDNKYTEIRKKKNNRSPIKSRQVKILGIVSFLAIIGWIIAIVCFSGAICIHAPMLAFVKKPPHMVEMTPSTDLECSAIGAPKKISGHWINIFRQIKVVTTNHTIIHADQNENELVVKTTVNGSGIYKCIFNDGHNTIESLTIVNTFLDDTSAILDQNKKSLLRRWLDDSNVAFPYKRCWRGSESNFSPQDFYDKCGGKRNTLTVIKSTDGKIFGGFSDVAWRRVTTVAVPITGDSRDSWEEWLQLEAANPYAKSEKAFLFAFHSTPPQKIPVYDSKRAICFRPGSGPCFGNSEFAAKFTRGRIDKTIGTYGPSYQSNLVHSFGTESIQEMEVFYMVD